ncbi:hypothetical protein V1514DRAFT_338040 [Lipomyces japonicus]|uniref:uncharacterized protein n=1 Tax=Lipomyces japonicus TaxID=56871 RepID=UPI0034CE9ED1
MSAPGSSASGAALASTSTATATGHHNIITQVSNHAVSLFTSGHNNGGSQTDNHGNDTITLDLRGKRIVLQRDELMGLPESILLCLFPNGVFVDNHGNVISNLTGSDVIYVDYSPACLEYAINTFRKVSATIAPSPPLSPTITSSGPPSPTASPSTFSESANTASMSILSLKPAVVVLQEDLDYYVIPPATVTVPAHVPTHSVSSASSRMSRLLRRASFSSLHSSDHQLEQSPPRPAPASSSAATATATGDGGDRTMSLEHPMTIERTPTYTDIVKLKIAVGEKLLNDNTIFAALKRSRLSSGAAAATTTQHQPESSTNKEHHQAPPSGSAEKHLVDMLCSSGFEESDTWGFRERDSQKTVISSLALVRLLATLPNSLPKNEASATTMTMTDSADQTSPTTSSTCNVAEIINPMAQKLLLFWRKPARKCWWDQLELDELEGFPGIKVKVHVRRMWTLELSVLGVR